MKNFIQTIAAPLVLIACLLVGCNDDDSLSLMDEEEFLTVRIDGEDLFVQNANGIISCKKFVSHTGSVDVLFQVSTNNGRNIEFRLYNYIGNNLYSLGNSSHQNSWIKYRQSNLEGEWINLKGNSMDLIEILEDDGNYLTGRFSFQGHNGNDLSQKIISDGNFKVKIEF